MIPDVHPIPGNPPDKSLVERVYHLERALAILWDQVWWMQLTAEKRTEYETTGHKAPISRFYRPLDEVIRGD